MKRIAAPLAAMLLFQTGCGGEDGSAKKVGRAVGESMTDFASGVGSGIDKRLEVNVELAPTVAEFGLSKTVSKHAGVDGREKGLSVYFLAEQPAAVRLVAKALNDAGQEIGRSTVDAEFAADDAKYVTFRFEAELDRQTVAKYVIDAKRSAPTDAATKDAAPAATSEAKSGD